MTKDEVKKTFDRVQAQLTEVAERFPWENREAYLSWLAQTYEYATHTTRILALTGAHIPMSQTPLATRFIQHATEEKGHDKLLINDAKALDVDLMRVPILPESEAFHKSLYYWIYNSKTPVIMGWVLVLEGFAVLNGPRLHPRCEKAYGKKPTSFVRVHAHEDIDHVEKAFTALDAYDEEGLKQIAHGLETYGKLYANVYEAIARDATSSSRRSKVA